MRASARAPAGTETASAAVASVPARRTAGARRPFTTTESMRSVAAPVGALAWAWYKSKASESSAWGPTRTRNQAIPATSREVGSSAKSSL